LHGVAVPVHAIVLPVVLQPITSTQFCSSSSSQAGARPWQRDGAGSSLAASIAASVVPTIWALQASSTKQASDRIGPF
jgi:hypothetical protein